MSIVGAGGIGTTTVAIAAAEALATNYADGIAFINVAPLNDAMQDIIVSHKTARMLPALDHCQPVVEAAAQLAETLLRNAPGIHILATSREPLRCKGEWVQRLPPLAMPPPAKLIPAFCHMMTRAIPIMPSTTSPEAKAATIESAGGYSRRPLSFSRSISGLTLSVSFGLPRCTNEAASRTLK